MSKSLYGKWKHYATTPTGSGKTREGLHTRTEDILPYIPHHIDTTPVPRKRPMKPCTVCGYFSLSAVDVETGICKRPKACARRRAEADVIDARARIYDIIEEYRGVLDRLAKDD
jgi:hypothetical protein